MSIYTVEYSVFGSFRKWLLAFRNFEHAKTFSKNDYTANVVVHNFRKLENAEYFLRNHCSFADFVEGCYTEEILPIRKMSGIVDKKL